MPTRPLFDTLRDLRYGALLDEAALKMQEVITAVTSTGKSGSLTIELKFKPASRTQGALEITDSIKVKKPEEPSGSTILFVTAENNLMKNDPRQGELELRSVPSAEPQALRTA